MTYCVGLLVREGLVMISVNLPLYRASGQPSGGGSSVPLTVAVPSTYVPSVLPSGAVG